MVDNFDFKNIIFNKQLLRRTLYSKLFFRDTAEEEKWV